MGIAIFFQGYTAPPPWLCHSSRRTPDISQDKGSDTGKLDIGHSKPLIRCKNQILKLQKLQQFLIFQGDKS